MEMILYFYDQMSLNKESVNVIKKGIDIDDGTQNVLLSIEEGGVLEGSIDNLYNFYEEGIRAMTLTWNYENEIGYPNAEYKYQHHGLKPFGFEVVNEMNKLGMIVDVSHLSDQGFFDVMRCTKKPVIASHSCSRTIQNHERNLTDEMIRLISEKGGVVGLNFFGFFINGTLNSKIDDMIPHLKHIHKVGGEGVLALGTDFDGVLGDIEIEDISKITLLQEAMRKSKFNERQIEKCMNLNALRVINEVLK